MKSTIKLLPVKIKFLTLIILVILSMSVTLAQAEHSKKDLNLSDSLNERIQKYIQMRDLLSSLDAIAYKGKTDKEIIKMVRNDVTNDFKDPDSAKFRNERVFRIKRNIDTDDATEGTDGIYVCGEVNGKNSYGAYVGYRRYWGGHFLVDMEDEDNELFPYTFLHYCSRK